MTNHIQIVHRKREQISSGKCDMIRKYFTTDILIVHFMICYINT
jgi:hypothetical protein